MKFKVGDFVTRSSYNNDIVFRIVSINNDVADLYGLNVRLKADALLSDLVLTSNTKTTDDELESFDDFNLDRSEYFYIPGTILHIDGDEDYLSRCMRFYNKMRVKANGVYIPEPEMSSKIKELIGKYHPDILIITGHDALYKKKGYNSNSKYQNSSNFIDTVKEARKVEKNQDKLIIIAGACQSNYEDLIKAGANFASSPKRINIHALDPAVIAVSLAFSDKSKSIDLLKLINKTKFGSEGIGGIITNGTMYVGYPR